MANLYELLSDLISVVAANTRAVNENTLAVNGSQAAGAANPAPPATGTTAEPPKRGPGRPPKNPTPPASEAPVTPPATSNPLTDSLQTLYSAIQAKGGELCKIPGGKDRLTECFAAIERPNLLVITEADKPVLFPRLLAEIEKKLAEATAPKVSDNPLGLNF